MKDKSVSNTIFTQLSVCCTSIHYFLLAGSLFLLFFPVVVTQGEAEANICDTCTQAEIQTALNPYFFKLSYTNSTATRCFHFFYCWKVMPCFHLSFEVHQKRNSNFSNQTDNLQIISSRSARKQRATTALFQTDKLCAFPFITNCCKGNKASFSDFLCRC